MRTFRCFLTVALSALVLFAGCKYDDDDLWDEVNKQAERIAALEEWQQTVNSNIGTLQQLVTALQDNDYVTGVTTFSTPAPGGYRITFTNSGEATIWNGADGADGATGATGAAGHSPVIGVAQDTDGKYYWTLDGDWLLADGNKVPVTGEKGDTGKSAYELAVENGYTGTLSEWLASLNGTNGVNGKSAYQQARDNGYTGTLTDWLASLQGINGTNGKSAYELAVENGYTGSLSDWLDSLNGTNGVDGKSAYEQACENGFWGTETDWLYSLTGAPGLSGKNGATPKVAIGSDGYWYISADGTAAGTPPGVGWTISVKATGDNGDMGPIGPQGPAGDIGPQGPQGDAIFAANGVDNSNPDYVVFTLADGTTKINVPKYKSIGISFTQPGAFIANTVNKVAYTSTGTSAPTDIRVTNVPAGWSVSIDKSACEFVITPPADFGAAGVEFGKATIWLDNGNQIAAMYNLELLNRRIAANAIGEYFYQNGTVAGVIYKANDGTPNSGGIVCLDQKNYVRWGDNDKNEQDAGVEGIRDSSDGYQGTFNLISKRKEESDFSTMYGAFYWIYQKNNYDVNGIWYMPAIDELKTLYNIRGTINPKITNAGGAAVYLHYYFSSTEYARNGAYIFNVYDGRVYSDPGAMSKGMGSDRYVRAIAKF